MLKPTCSVRFLSGDIQSHETSHGNTGSLQLPNSTELPQIWRHEDSMRVTAPAADLQKMFLLYRFSLRKTLGARLKKFPSALLTIYSVPQGEWASPDTQRRLRQNHSSTAKVQGVISNTSNKSEQQNSREKEKGSSKITHIQRLQIYYPEVLLRKHNKENAIKSETQDRITLIDMMGRST